MGLTKKISIVMPVYNTEKYLKRCIKSLIKQSYRNLEIIIVNDCSPGNADEIVAEFSKVDDRIVYLKHEKNKGLFRARLTGAEKATGDYIAFIDSDDYVSLDFYHSLLKSAVKNNSDIVISKTIFENPDGYDYIKILHDDCFLFDTLKGNEIKERFFGQKGLCYSWHTVWNKLYKKDLWDKCFPYYNTITQHLIMTEDIAFSSLLFYNAEIVSKVDNDAYFYCENEQASTNSSQITLKRFTKNMEDIKRVFNFVENYFNKVNADDFVKNGFLEFKKYYSRMWRELGETQFTGSDKKVAKEIMDNFLPNYFEYTQPDNHFFASIDTPWNGSLEYIKEQILTSDCEYISFDIFDTVVLRPVYKPTDVFLLMDKDFEKLFKTNLTFSKIRVDAEAETRKRMGIKCPSYQDVTIDEIYDCMSDLYGIDKSITDKLKEKEEELEISLCMQRKATKELYDVAMVAGKKVIFTSDMYLDRKTIEAILEKNDYKGYERLFLSSEERLTKSSGELFRAVLRELNTKGSNIIHIGDTWQNDINNAKSCGITPIFLPKTIEVFENKIADISTNNCATIANKVMSSMHNGNKTLDSFGTRTLVALVANKYFDNPYRSFNPESDFNADNYFIGYYALGMHLIGLSSWIYDITSKNGYEKVDYLSRDGYLPKKIYDKMAKFFGNAPKSDYIYTSRKALLSGMIKSKLDFYDLPVEYRNHTPRTLLKLLAFCSSEISVETLKNDGILIDKAFYNKDEFNFFIKYFIDNIYDDEKYKKTFERAKGYYSKLGKNEICFDLGYSGRIQAAISNLAGYGVDVLFVHNEPSRADMLSRKEQFNIFNFYDFSPYMTGLIREHILSDPNASCIGFDEKSNPIFEDEEKTYQDLFTVGLMQKGAEDLVDDFVNIFGEYKEYIKFRPYELSLAFEGYLRFARDVDRRPFAASYFEDMVYGARDKINIYEFIKHQIISLPVNESSFNAPLQTEVIDNALRGKGIFSKTIALAILDKPLLKWKIKLKLWIKLQKYPRLFKVCRGFYRKTKMK